MLDYKKYLSYQDKEVRDPVSGYSYPLSVNDVHSHEQLNAIKGQEQKLASMLVSTIK